MSETLIVEIVPVLKDNFSYLVYPKGSNQCIVIDPAAAGPVLEVLKKKNLEPQAIWNTHWHSDHIGGNEELKRVTSAQIIGPELEKDKIPHIDQGVAELDLLSLGSHKAKVFETPGHTLGHVIFWFYNDHILFAGDALFSCGCGKLFEGTYQQMWHSLCKIRALPKETAVYFGHEYTQNNIAFAKSIEPDNQNLISYEKEIATKCQNQQPSCPTHLEKELLVNPFLRLDMPIYKQLLNIEPFKAEKALQMLREKKEAFEP